METPASTCKVPPAASSRRGLLRVQTVADLGYICFLYFTFVGFLPFQPNLITVFVDSGDPNPLNQVVLLVSALFVFGACMKPSVFRLTPFTCLLLLTFLWFLWTLTWSRVPDIGFRRLMLTLLTTSVVVIYTRGSGPWHALKILGAFLGTIVTLSVLSSLVVPGAIDPLTGSSHLWRGLFNHRLLAGLVAAYSAVHFLVQTGRPNRLQLTLGVLSLLLLAATYAKTPALALIVAVVVALGVTYVLGTYGRMAAYFLVVCAGLLLAGLLLIYSDLIVSFFSDSGALTGRVELWTAIVKAIGDVGWMKGSGFGSLFRVGSETPLAPYLEGWLLYAPHPHNGYLGVLATTGIPGLVLAATTFFVIPFWLLTSSRAPSATTLKFLMLLVFLSIHNLAENSLLDRNSIGSVLLVIVAASVDALHSRGLLTRPCPTSTKATSRRGGVILDATNRSPQLF